MGNACSSGIGIINHVVTVHTRFPFAGDFNRILVLVTQSTESKESKLTSFGFWQSDIEREVLKQGSASSDVYTHLLHQSQCRIAVIHQVAATFFGERTFRCQIDAQKASLQGILTFFGIAFSEFKIEDPTKGIAIFCGKGTRHKIGITEQLGTENRDTPTRAIEAGEVVRTRNIDAYHAP